MSKLAIPTKCPQNCTILNLRLRVLNLKHKTLWLYRKLSNYLFKLPDMRE